MLRDEVYKYVFVFKEISDVADHTSEAQASVRFTLCMGNSEQSFSVLDGAHWNSTV